MPSEAQLRDRLRKIEALFARAGTPGEKHAAGAARDRIRARLAELEDPDPAIEMRFRLRDQWSRRLFLALCRRYGLKPYRLPRQRVTTVMLRVPRGFADQVLWPEYQRLNRLLTQYLNAVTALIVQEALRPDASEAAKRK